jgi:hypothetical protein
MGVMMAPVDGSGSWPAWMQTVLKRARSLSFTVGPFYSDIILRRNPPGISRRVTPADDVNPTVAAR